MKELIYICTDDSLSGTGKTVESAFLDYCNNGGDASYFDCDFYEGNKVEVELIIKK